MYVVIINFAVGISECKTNVRDCVKEWEQIVFQKEVLILVHQGESFLVCCDEFIQILRMFAAIYYINQIYVRCIKAT